tara:strand:+ start:3658 stop:4284 length:627 start_codon:yes stop_codon:yes gene_type:complete
LSWEGFLPEDAIVMGTKKSELKDTRPLDSFFQLRKEMESCHQCSLHEFRSRIVHGVGAEHADLFLIGDAPGAVEDQEGVPFQGEAGALLDKMLAAIGQNRTTVFMTTLVKCAPPMERKPNGDEVLQCRSFLLRALRIVQPKVILTLGSFPTQSLLNTTLPISQMRGRLHVWEEWNILPTFDPSYLLRNPSAKKEAWKDLQWVQKILET